MKKRVLFVCLATTILFFGLGLTFRHLIPCPARQVLSQQEFPVYTGGLGIKELAAIPVFTRKYDVSCQQCHTAFPNLTPFGTAFKKNGLRFPGEGDDFDSPDTLTVGEGHEKVALPKFPPVAVTALSQFISQTENNTDNSKAQFQQLGAALGILSSATLGDHFSFWGGVGLRGEVNTTTGVQTGEIELERVYAAILPFKKPFLLIRVGNFEPSVLAVSDHRSLLGGYFATSGRAVGDNGFALESAQQGLEFSGVTWKGRFGYALGVVEGTGNRYNNQKDLYGRVEYKFGGLRLDGVEEEGSRTLSSWRDDSVTIGGFGYLGFATVADALSSQQDRFALFGGDIGVNLWNFLASLGYIRQENNRPLLATPNVELSTSNFFGELNYVFKRFIPGFRYELFDSGATVMDQRLTLGGTVLLRPNLKTFLRGSLVKASGGSFTDNPEFRLGLLLAI